MDIMDEPPLANLLGFLALASYVVTLLPTILRIVFPRTKETGIPKLLLKNRRVIGIIAFFFALGHGFLMVKKRNFDFFDPKTFLIYIQGIITFTILTLLAITSNNWSVRKLKKNWKKLHKLTYLAMFLLIGHIWDKMSGHWTYLTPIGFVAITGITALFLVRLGSEYQSKQQKVKGKKTFKSYQQKLLNSVISCWANSVNVGFFVLHKLIDKKVTAVLITTTTVVFVGLSWSRLLPSFFSLTPAVNSKLTIQPSRTLKVYTTWIYAIAISPDGKTLVCGSYDGTIKVVDLPTGQVIHTLKGHADAVVSLAISTDGHILASGSWDNRIKLWNLKTGTLIHTLNGHKDDVMAITVNANGKLLASGSADKTIKLWNLDTGKELFTFQNADWVRSVAFSPDNQTLASGSANGSIRIWQLDPLSVKPQHILRRHSRAVWSVAFSPDGQTLASGSVDKTIKLWRLSNGNVIHTLSRHSGAVWSVAFSPQAHTLASGSYDRTIKLWDIATGKLVGNLVGHTKPVWSVAFSPDGQTITSGSGDETIKQWSVPHNRANY